MSGDLTPHPAVFGYVDGAPAERNLDDSAPYVPRSVVVDDDFDWGGDAPMRRRWRDTVIYEMHVKGMTALHDRVPEELRGTYAGLATPAVTDYLRDLGVTAVELLPVHQFVSEPWLAKLGPHQLLGLQLDRLLRPAPRLLRRRATAAARSPSSSRWSRPSTTPASRSSSTWSTTTPPRPARRARRCRSAGSTTAASTGGCGRPRTGRGPPSFNDTYWDVTGCGNTVDSSNPLALRMILDSLRYWVTEMHVDGFRFDLMSALTRTGYDIDMHCALLVAIGQDPILRHVKLIAEAWDASMDGYLVGRMPPPWVEWNDQYRDTIRDFWRGHSSGIRTVATRLAGSSDLYADDGRSAYNSVNFVTAHDGFTLRDLVSYDHKHNEANGEDNRDGTDDNRSWNHGAEGETDDEGIVALRRRQAANLMATLCLSNGVPMITAGDERGRTQRGNNNAYSQDNEISWIDWRPDDAWLDVYEITKAALRLRREHPALRQRHWFEGRPAIRGGPKDLAWLHPSGREMTGDDWHDERADRRRRCSSPAPRCAPPARTASSRWTSRS